ncbi:MAG: tetratricopeptide repeat protein [Gemmatimonadetes bacterium]|nr:tetratricopeptide repeat protein [Gemmatimonadota bacterium]
MDRGETAGGAGTVTFLFSDIEGSTRLLQDLGDAYRELLSTHHALVRRAIEASQGRVVDQAGDGFFAAFSSARDAVGGGVAIQRAMAAAVWPGGRSVVVRIGLHTGEPTLSAEGYVGLDVHRAARIGAAAAGGQVLLSKTTRDLVGSDLPTAVALRDLGAHRLKDLHEPEHLFQLVIDGLRSEFPPPRSLGAKRLNFPATPTRLIARESEISAIRAILRSEGVRLVTLTGPGGTGKTRLGIAIADTAADDFRDGAVFVPLSSLTDGRLVATTVVQALGLMEGSGRPTIDVLLSHLHDRQMLVVLDNFEQVVDAAPVVAQVLAACRDVSTVVTSRIALRLTGEREFPVSPLPLPDVQRDDTAATVVTSPAVALFLERARAVRPDFAIDDENAPAIAELCIRLDGLPLALELAAARIRIFSPHALLARLGNRLDLLRGGARDMPERHQTLRGAIGWSYELLDPTEQALFRRLAVFAGGFSLDAVEAVTRAAGPLAIDGFDGVSSLVERSLVRREPDFHGEPRFGMLETVREFGLECLDRAGEAAATRAAHGRFYLELAETTAPRLAGLDQLRSIERLEIDIDNLRAAFDGFDENDAEPALRLGAALHRFWLSRGHQREARRRLESCLARPGADRPTAARALALHALGNVTHELSLFGTARAFVDESLAIFRHLGDERGIANASTALAWINGMIGHHDEAREFANEALAMHRRLGHRRSEALIEHNLGLLDFFTGDIARAREHIERAIGLMRELGDRRGAAYFSIGLGWVHREFGEWSESARRVDEALVVLATLRDTQLTAWGLVHRGILSLEMAEPGAGVRTLEESLERWQQVGNGFGTAFTFQHLALAESDRGNPSRADALARESLDYWVETGSTRGYATGLATRGEILVAAGRPAEAASLLAEAIRTQLALGELPQLRRSLETAALALQVIDDESAIALLGAADALLARLGVARAPRITRRIDEAVARLTNSRGAGTLERARAAGAAMSAAEAAAAATRALDGAIGAATSR